MCNHYPLCLATASDSEAIASLFALSWSSPISQLQFGHDVNPKTLIAAMTPRIEQHMKKPNIQFVVARDPTTYRVIACAQWALSNENDDNSEEPPDVKAERQQLDDEAYRNALPDHSNKDLVVEFTRGLRNLRESVLGVVPSYMLENIATHPDHRRKGLATNLIKWIFPQADKQGYLVYLDTASDNFAMQLYRNLGFEEKGRRTIESLERFAPKKDMERYACGKSHTHVAMTRPPKWIRRGEGTLP